MVKIILSLEANNVLLKLKKSSHKVDKSIYESIKEKLKLIKNNPKLGKPIKKKLIPKKYINKYGISILFKLRLSNYWRMLYTINNNNEIEIIVFIIDLLDHKKYNKKFSFK
jgi:mRNA-degrading endonuclease RelE of RelBE toxin-antitoxin system